MALESSLFTTLGIFREYYTTKIFNEIIPDYMELQRSQLEILPRIFVNLDHLRVSGSSPLTLEHTWDATISLFGYFTCL